MKKIIIVCTLLAGLNTTLVAASTGSSSSTSTTLSVERSRILRNMLQNVVTHPAIPQDAKVWIDDLVDLVGRGTMMVETDLPHVLKLSQVGSSERFIQLEEVVDDSCRNKSRIILLFSDSNWLSLDQKWTTINDAQLYHNHHLSKISNIHSCSINEVLLPHPGHTPNIGIPLQEYIAAWREVLSTVYNCLDAYNSSDANTARRFVRHCHPMDVPVLLGLRRILVPDPSNGSWSFIYPDGGLLDLYIEANNDYYISLQARTLCLLGSDLMDIRKTGDQTVLTYIQNGVIFSSYNLGTELNMSKFFDIQNGLSEEVKNRMDQKAHEYQAWFNSVEAETYNQKESMNEVRQVKLVRAAAQPNQIRIDLMTVNGADLEPVTVSKDDTVTTLLQTLQRREGADANAYYSLVHKKQLLNGCDQIGSLPMITNGKLSLTLVRSPNKYEVFKQYILDTFDILEALLKQDNSKPTYNLEGADQNNRIAQDKTNTALLLSCIPEMKQIIAQHVFDGNIELGSPFMQSGSPFFIKERTLNLNLNNENLRLPPEAIQTLHIPFEGMKFRMKYDPSSSRIIVSFKNQFSKSFTLPQIRITDSHQFNLFNLDYSRFA